MSVATKNKWIDVDGRIYILYQLSEIQEDMNISKKKACDSLQELENVGLIEKQQNGNGKPTRIYVKNFSKPIQKYNRSVENELEKHFKKGENDLSENIKFEYFYGQEAEMLSFYRIPKLLFSNELFKGLSTDAKVLYGLMLDRMSLSIKNKWFDNESRAYIYFSVEDTMEMLNCKKNKAIDTIKELDIETGIGLIEKKRQGQGKIGRAHV